MNTVRIRQEFFRNLDVFQPFHDLFDLLPDVAFFMKDKQGRFIMNNRLGCEYCRVSSELETIGRTDYDYFPKDKADAYVESDRRVMETGVPIINEIAAAPEGEGSVGLIVYSKVPLRDRNGRIIGVAGIHRRIDGSRARPKSYGRLSDAVQYIHEHYALPMSTPKLAKMAGVSPSQFSRRFRKLFGTSMRQYLLRVRVNAACNMLTHTDKGITDVSLDAGFYDHSHFTRTFTRMMGVTPLHYRKRHEME
jgi:AraC-like DNA-binding protein